jgi:pyruvate dehydrogenase E2 component (dihydrolipoamide acetyltransferase)
MIHDIFMPALSSTMTEGKIVSWTKAPGDRVEKGETVLVVESDKADMDVESFYEGYLATILVEAGQEAPVGETIALIAETLEEVEMAKQQAPSATVATPTSAPVATPAPASTPTPTVSIPSTPTVAPIPVTSNGSNGRIVASPRARKLAKQLGVNLNTLNGSGPHGRIVTADVERATGKAPSAPVVSTAVVTPVISAPVVAPTLVTPVVTSAVDETVPLNTLQKAVVQNMVASLAAPTFHVGYTITTDALDKLYQQVKSKGVTMTALLAKAVAVTLRKNRIMNANYTEQGIAYHSACNVSVAVAMPDGGLITPVLQNADQVDLYSLSRNWKDLVDRARLKQLQPQEYNSGTFTLSNLGMFGVDRFDAILPPGQGAILAIGASRPTVVATDDGMIGVKRQMQVNLTCDHRVIYGAEAASFLKDLADLIENNPQSLVL